jgi:hypothetical protein
METPQDDSPGAIGYLGRQLSTHKVSAMKVTPVLMNLLDGAHNVIHIFTSGQKQAVLEPDRFSTGALRIGTEGFEGSIIDGAVVVTAVDRTSARVEILPQEHGILVQGMRVTGEAGNPFRLKRRHETRPRNSELGLVEAKDVKVMRVAGGKRLNPKRTNSR